LIRSLLPALLIRRPLPRRDLVQGAPFRLHPHVGRAREDSARDMPSDTHDHLVARARDPQPGCESYRASAQQLSPGP
jgi:hypothetical protein